MNKPCCIAVSSGTRVLSSSKSFSVHNGEQVVLNCTNTDLHSLHGQVTIAWDKDGVAIPDSDPRLNVRRNGTLLIAHAREKDAGVYKCVTTAKHFLSTDITTFTVLGEWERLQDVATRSSGLVTSLLWNRIYKLA